VAAEPGADVDDVDAFGIEGLGGGAKLVRAVLVGVDGVVVDGGGEEEEEARGERGGGGGGEGLGDGELAHGGTERGATASGEPAERGGR
jgi:hypothetical protein